jgi:hypothetical protein
VTQELWIPGQLPSLNVMLADRAARAGNRYAKLKAKWTDDIALLARVAKLKPVARARFRFTWHERNRQRNPDNIVAARKLVLDGLVKARIMANDGWDQVAGFTDAWSVAGQPGVRVTIDEHVTAFRTGDEERTAVLDFLRKRFDRGPHHSGDRWMLAGTRDVLEAIERGEHVHG